jgi:hypothetical protein
MSADRVVTYLSVEALEAMEADNEQRVPEAHSIRVKGLREQFMAASA